MIMCGLTSDITLAQFNAHERLRGGTRGAGRGLDYRMVSSEQQELL
jgi:hypothetical protein